MKSIENERCLSQPHSPHVHFRKCPPSSFQNKAFLHTFVYIRVGGSWDSSYLYLFKGIFSKLILKAGIIVRIGDLPNSHFRTLENVIYILLILDTLISWQLFHHLIAIYLWNSLAHQWFSHLTSFNCVSLGIFRVGVC